MAERAEDVRWAACGALMLLSCATACGGGDDAGGEGDAGGSTASGGSVPRGGASSGGTSPNGGTSGGGSANGGSSSGGTANGGSGGGSGGIDCAGAFGTPRVVLEMEGTSFSGLTLRPDELELLYGAGPVDGSEQGFFHARRASKADVFSSPVALPELDAACETASMSRTGDLTYDGLGFYFTCYDTLNPASESQLRYARRASLDAPFVVERVDLLYVSGGPSVSRDELELFAAGSGRAMHHVRSDTSQSFGPGEPIAGFESYRMATPEIAPDGRTIYASQSTSNTFYGLVEATRSAPDAAFGPLTVLIPEIMNEIYGSPAISNDCRSLYYVHYAIQNQSPSFRVEVMTR